jgi:hypothetical protein
LPGSAPHRGQVAAEDGRARLGEKRRIYVAASAALNNGLLAMSSEESGAVTEARRSASIAAWELQLIASADVGRHARSALNALDARDGGTLLESLAELIPAMRADLGVEPLDISDLW